MKLGHMYRDFFKTSGIYDLKFFMNHSFRQTRGGFRAGKIAMMK